jgi:hypothetical protein
MSNGGVIPTPAQQLMMEFEHLRVEQWEKGSTEYGDVRFLEHDDATMFQMLYEELADVANYAMMVYVRWRLLEATVASRFDPTTEPSEEGSQHSVPSGPGTFTPNSDLPGFLSSGEGVQDSG